MKKVMVLFALLPAVMVLSCINQPAPAPAPPPAEQSAPPPPPPPPPSPPEVLEKYSGDIILEGAKDYQVAQGDTLAKIARAQYGSANGYFFPLILMASRTTVNDPDKLEPGMRLTVPDLQRNLNDAGARQKIKDFLNEIGDAYIVQTGKNWGQSTGNQLKAIASSL